MLRRHAIGVDPSAVIAQRLKRFPSIEKKLRRFPTMQLHSMQDLGGCRAIVAGVGEVDAVVDRFRKSPGKQILKSEFDYLRARLREDGYRSHHLVIQSRSAARPEFDDMLVEVQARTQLQHAWATCVETIDFFGKQGLKTGGGDAEWRRFFALMGAELALAEGLPLQDGVQTHKRERRREIKQLARQLDVLNRLSSYAFTAQQVSGGRRGHVTLHLHFQKGSTVLDIQHYGTIRDATKAYDALEARSSGDSSQDIALVRVADVRSLQLAYPNYFADTLRFSNEVARAIL